MDNDLGLTGGRGGMGRQRKLESDHPDFFHLNNRFEWLTQIEMPLSKCHLDDLEGQGCRWGEHLLITD